VGSILEVRHLTVDMPGKRVLDNVSFGLDRGTITALVGPNGAGKSTLMRCIVALDPIWHGTVTLEGVNVSETPRAMHRQVGYLADDFGLYDELSVAHCLEHVGLARGLSPEAIQTRLQVVVRETQLAELLPHRAGVLSKGQRQRVGLALALLHDPILLVLDEPATGLDPEARQLLGECLNALRQAGKTILVSSHILAELEQYATHMLLLDAGRLKTFVPVGSQNAVVRCRLILRVSGGQETGGRFLATQPGVQELKATPEGFLFDWLAPETELTALLEACLVAKVPVIGLERVQERMEQVYLQQVAR